MSTFSGTLDTNDPALYDYSSLGRASFDPDKGYYATTGAWRTPAGSYLIDSPSSNGAFYSGPTEGSGRGFGSGTETAPTVITGDSFGIFQGSLVLPGDWVSGAYISGSITWENATLNSLGYDSTQEHVWVLRGTGDTITMSVIPEPQFAIPLLSLFALLLYIRKHRR